MVVAMSSTCPGLYCGRLLVNGSVEGDCGVCPRGERANIQKVCERCGEAPELYDWLYLGFMAMLPLVLHWFFIEWYSGKKSSSAVLQHVTAMLECGVSAVVTLLLTEPVGLLSIRSCRVQMLSDWYTMLYNPSPDYINTLHCTQEAVYPLSSAVLQHVTAMLECGVSAVVTLLLTEPVGLLSIRSCRVQMLSDWYTMLYNPSPDYINTLHCTQEAVYPLYTMVLIYYAFCLVLMMLLRPLLVKKLACGLGKSDRFRSVYAALYFFPILTVLQAIGGGLLYYAFPYIILVLSLVTLAVYMSASEIQSFKSLFSRKKRLVVLLSHWLLHAYGMVSISLLDQLEVALPLLTLVPGPTLFYIATARFTKPSRILSEGGSGH